MTKILKNHSFISRSWYVWIHLYEYESSLASRHIKRFFLFVHRLNHHRRGAQKKTMCSTIWIFNDFYIFFFDTVTGFYVCLISYYCYYLLLIIISVYTYVRTNTHFFMSLILKLYKYTVCRTHGVTRHDCLRRTVTELNWFHLFHSSSLPLIWASWSSPRFYSSLVILARSQIYLGPFKI